MLEFFNFLPELAFRSPSIGFMYANGISNCFDFLRIYCFPFSSSASELSEVVFFLFYARQLPPELLKAFKVKVPSDANP